MNKTIGIKKYMVNRLSSRSNSPNLEQIILLTNKYVHMANKHVSYREKGKKRLREKKRKTMRK